MLREEGTNPPDLVDLLGYSYTLDVSHETRQASSIGEPLFLCATFTCGGIPLGLVLGHLPEGGQPQWGCQAVYCSSMKPQGSLQATAGRGLSRLRLWTHTHTLTCGHPLCHCPKPKVWALGQLYSQSLQTQPMNPGAPFVPCINMTSVSRWFISMMKSDFGKELL